MTGPGLTASPLSFGVFRFQNEYTGGFAAFPYAGDNHCCLRDGLGSSAGQGIEAGRSPLRQVQLPCHGIQHDQSFQLLDGGVDLADPHLTLQDHVCVAEEDISRLYLSPAAYPEDIVVFSGFAKNYRRLGGQDELDVGKCGPEQPTDAVLAGWIQMELHLVD